MKRQSWLTAAAVVLSAALINPAESAAQRQRWPGGNGGGRQDNGGGGAARQRDSGGGGQRNDGGGSRARDGGGSRPRDGGGARQQDGGARPQGGGRAEVRSAQPRDRGGDRADRGRRESAPPVARESAPPPQVRAEGNPQDRPRAQRRFPTEGDRNSGDRGNVIRDRGDRGGVITDRGDRGGVITNRGDRGNVVRGDAGARVRDGNARVAVPRTGPLPDRRDGRYDRNVYGSYYSRRDVYGRYAYGGSRNIYIVPRGRTYIYYPRYYYTPYSFGYGPLGRGHFYFDLHYSSYIWHPYSVYRYGTYGTYGYPIGELRLKVHPRDAQVFIDGYYAGRVDDFDGVFQSLRLEEGEYQVEIVLPGYEPLAFDVRIFPGEKTTYEGDLIPELP
jgi:hypothetical protein